LPNPRVAPPRARRAWILAAAAASVALSCRDRELPIADPRARELAAGQRIFERKCASCHNTNGDGQTITAGKFRYANLIDGVWRSDGSPAAIERQIREGHDPMPKFQGKLTDEEIRQTVGWVLELDRRAAAERRKRTASGP
jgi:mono/diheme cytochrome c family protein